MAELKFDTIIAAGDFIFGLTEEKKMYLFIPKRVVTSEDKKSKKITSAYWKAGPTTDDAPTVKNVGIEEGM